MKLDDIKEQTRCFYIRNMALINLAYKSFLVWCNTYTSTHIDFLFFLHDLEKIYYKLVRKVTYTSRLDVHKDIKKSQFWETRNFLPIFHSLFNLYKVIYIQEGKNKKTDHQQPNSVVAGPKIDLASKNTAIIHYNPMSSKIGYTINLCPIEYKLFKRI